MPLKIAPMSALPLPAELTNSVERTMDQALANRPDLAAQLAMFRAREADVSNAKAEYYPRIGLDGSVGQAYSHFDAYTGGKTTGPFDYDDTIYGINLTFRGTSSTVFCAVTKCAKPRPGASGRRRTFRTATQGHARSVEVLCRCENGAGTI